MVQYRGSAPAVADVQAGRVDLLCDVSGSIVPYIQANSVRGYVLTGAHRLSSLPNLPTVSELGIRGLDITAWYGLYAPRQTPPAIVERLAAALAAAIRDPATQAQLATMETQAFEPAQATPQALHDRLAQQVPLWTAIIREAGVTTN